MQLPVVTNPNSIFLIQKDGVDLQALARRVAEIIRGDDATAFDYPRLRDAFGEWFDLFYLEPGYFHLIDTSKVHSLINAGSTDRITLAIDMVRNDWLDHWLAENMTGSISALSADEKPGGNWDWSALKHGLLSHPRIQLDDGELPKRREAS
jgi:hypothetical protein